MIKCDTCPQFKDTAVKPADADGYHYGICGMTGNIVYPTPHKIKRQTGSGYIHLGVSTCGLYETVEQVLAHMTEPQIRRWKEAQAKEPRHPWAEPEEPAPKGKKPQDDDLPGQMSIADWLEMEGPEDDA